MQQTHESVKTYSKTKTVQDNLEFLCDRFDEHCKTSKANDDAQFALLVELNKKMMTKDEEQDGKLVNHSNVLKEHGKKFLKIGSFLTLGAAMVQLAWKVWFEQ